MFEKRQDMIMILEDLKKVLDHVEKQAEYGYKFYPENHYPVNGDHDNFKLYYNEITLSENMVLLKLEKFNLVHLGHNVLNILTTSDEEFFNDANNFIQKVMKNSMLISVTSEKARKRFFNFLSNKIETLISNL